MYEPAAHELLDMNFNIALLLLGTARPAFDWKENLSTPMSHAEIARRFNGRDYNIGIICGGSRETGANVLGIVFDNRELFERLFPTFPSSPMIAQTATGFHAYYRLLLGQSVPASMRLRGENIGLRSHDAILMAPPSFDREIGVRFRWVAGPVDANRLPFFPVELVRESNAFVPPVAVGKTERR